MPILSAFRSVNLPRCPE